MSDIKDFIRKNIISDNKLSDFCVKEYNKENNTELDDYDFYHLDNCKELEKNYYIKMLELSLYSYYNMYIDVLNEYSDCKNESSKNPQFSAIL